MSHLNIIMLISCAVHLAQSMHHGDIELHGNNRLVRAEKEISNRTSLQGVDPSNGTADYPTNHRITKAQVLRFDEYYNCLNNTKIKPRALYVVAGSSISLQCTACVSPHENSIVWRYSNRAINFTTKIVHFDKSVNRHSEDLRGSLSDNGLVLTLFGLSADESGHYDCYQDGSVITPHIVQVADVAELMAVVRPKTAPYGPYPSEAVVLKSIGVTISRQWSDWSSCSTCPHVGKRIRIGICMVAPMPNSSVAVEKIFQLFSEGLPCRSAILPDKIRNHPEVLSKRNEYMVGFCKIARKEGVHLKFLCSLSLQPQQERCPRRKKYLLKETAGTLLKKLNQAGTSYSLLKKLPNLPPPVRHSMLYLTQLDTAYIQCPGSDNNNALVYWRMGFNLNLKKSERIHLSPTHILVIRDLTLSDSNIYSCWQRHRLVGIVTLTVSRPVELSFEEAVNAAVLISIIASFIIISLKILRLALKRRRLSKKSK